MALGILCVLLAAGAPIAAASEVGQVESTIRKLEDRWRVAQHKNDAATLALLLAPDLTFIGTSGAMRDRQGYIASRASSAIPQAASYEYSELRVRVFDAVAIVTGHEATTGQGTTFQGRFTHVWALRSGEWRLVAIQRTEVAR